MKRRIALQSVLTTALFFACMHSAYSQATTSFAQLNGAVDDASGASISKASVTLRDLATNQTYRSTTNDAGFYVVPALPPGRYELTVESTGFSRYTQTGIGLTVGQTATINLSLTVAGVASSVTVSTADEVPLLEPTRTEISQVVDAGQIK